MDIKQLFARVAKADFADAVGVTIAEDVIAAAHVRKRLHNVSIQAVSSRAIDAPREGRAALIVEYDLGSVLGPLEPEDAPALAHLGERLARLLVRWGFAERNGPPWGGP